MTTASKTALTTASRAALKTATVAMTAGILLLAAGCHHQRRRAYQPAPPPLHRSGRSSGRNSERSRPPETSQEPSRGRDEALGRPILVETGMASWYGPNFSHRHAADGSKFNKNAMTAANKTLPMGTVVRVTNLSNGEQVVVRITDRGPFSHGRILDLSEGAAKKIGLYRMGVARVRIEAFAHATADPAGKWCVQTGAFKRERQAIDLKEALLRRYRGSRVIEFAGPTGFWVRIDPAQHNRTEALAIQNWIGAPDAFAKAYLVRLD